MSGWKSSAVLLLGAALTGLAGCSRPETTASTPQVLRLSQRNEPADLDPARTTLADEFGILRALLEGLLIPGENGGDPRPGAAIGWQVSPDGLTYTFQLRPEASWSDGVPVVARHFLDAYRRLLTPATAAPKAAMFFGVRNARAFAQGTLADFTAVGFRAPGPHQVVIELEAPNPRFPHVVASGPWLPVRTDVVERHGRTWTKPENFVGNGPFRLAEWRADQRIVARRNPTWHGAAGVRLHEIHFVRFDGGDGEERAYRAGQIDATMAVPLGKVATYERERGSEIHRQTMIETRYLAFNTRRPPLDDPRVRRALSLALDRRKLTERVLLGAQTPAGRLLPPALRRADEPAIAPGEHQHDPALARSLLAAAGVNARNFPRLELSFWSNPPLLEAVQAMWREELGLELALTQREARVHLAALASGGYDIALVAAIPDIADPADLLGDFVSGAPDNYPGWSDPGFDAALRRGDLAGAETRLLEAAPLAPLYFNTKVWLMSRRVRGWQEDGLWTRCYQQVSLAAP